MKNVTVPARLAVLSLSLGLFLNAIPSHPVVSINQATRSFRADSTQLDAETGLVVDESLMLVKAQCSGCHSSALIRQSHFSQEKWIERIRWMQRTQNLWNLGESEPAIVAYLTKHYGPLNQSFDGRREPLTNIRWYPAKP